MCGGQRVRKNDWALTFAGEGDELTTCHTGEVDGWGGLKGMKK